MHGNLDFKALSGRGQARDTQSDALLRPVDIQRVQWLEGRPYARLPTPGDLYFVLDLRVSDRFRRIPGLETKVPEIEGWQDEDRG